MTKMNESKSFFEKIEQRTKNKIKTLGKSVPKAAGLSQVTVELKSVINLLKNEPNHGSGARF